MNPTLQGRVFPGQKHAAVNERPPLRLSLILPNYNHAHMLPRALDSVLNQSRLPDEIIVSDDASTDNSVELIEAYVRRHPQIRFLRNPKNLGAVGNQNYLLGLATGDFIYALGADEHLLPGAFERAMQLLEDHPQAGGCFCDLVLVDTDGHGLVHRRFGLPEGYYSPLQLARAIRERNFTVTGINTIFSRRALLEPGTLLPESLWMIDWLWTSIIAFRYGLCYTHADFQRFEVSVTSYAHQGHVSAEHRRVVRTILEHVNQPDFDDVRRFIVRSGAMEQMGPVVLEEIAMRPSFWKFASWPLLRRLAVSWMKWRLLKTLPFLRVLGENARRQREHARTERTPSSSAAERVGS